MSASASTPAMATEMARRRHVLAGLAASLVLPSVSWADVGSPHALAAGKLGEDYVLHGLDSAGQSLFQIPLPARGHAAAAHPTRAEAVAFARRPGTFALVIDCLRGSVLHQLTPPAGRQFNGHGSFSADGGLLMTSEVIADTSEGRIGLWETARYARIGEWASHGIGPHDLKRRSDGALVVANGGIRTDPQDRRKLNLDAMAPNLTLLSAEGALLDQVALAPDLHQNSIRHLALLPGGALAFAMQWEGDPALDVPQLGLWTPSQPPQPKPARETEAFAMQGYAGSIAASTAGDLIALTSPKGGVVMVFDAAGQPLATHHRADSAGICAAPGGFMVTDGQGAIWACDATGMTLLAQHDTLWDNHLIALA
jgi:hypothetical protein